eukprot:TRINITY_DN36993_c0_g1_i1.p1 TRINITY_DN36993_c0_g1~~TRINITY_DN36993_c0_g1_i1.p1  ORF type:complete len:551 (+),score=103.11 TRINITY_DN36993_c0_g1_i1:45-1697(+)
MPGIDRTIKRRLHVITFYLVVVIFYLLIGGLAMMFLESDNEKSNNKVLEEYVQEIKLTPEQITKLEDLGLCSFPGEHTLRWTYTGAVFYTLTVVTTIGYGSYAPRTLGGRIFTVFYAMFGISVIGLLLSNLANVIAALFQSVLRRISPPRITVPQHVHDALRQEGNVDTHTLKSIIISVTETDEKRWREDSEGKIFKDIVNMYKDSHGLFDREAVCKAVARWYEIKQLVPVSITWQTFFFFFSACGAWVGIWAGIFSKLEGWGYFDSLWFTVITLSTIGFGDFAPETRGGRIAAFIFISPGIGMVAAFISAITNMFEAYRFWWMQRAYERGWVSEKIMVAQGIPIALDARDPGECVPPESDRDTDQEMIELDVGSPGVETDVVEKEADITDDEDPEKFHEAVPVYSRPAPVVTTKMKIPRNRELPSWPESNPRSSPEEEDTPHTPYSPYVDSAERVTYTTKVPSTLLPKHSGESFDKSPDVSQPPQPPKLKRPRNVSTHRGGGGGGDGGTGGTKSSRKHKRNEYPTDELMGKLFIRPTHGKGRKSSRPTK